MRSLCDSSTGSDVRRASGALSNLVRHCPSRRDLHPSVRQETTWQERVGEPKGVVRLVCVSGDRQPLDRGSQDSSKHTIRGAQNKTIAKEEGGVSVGSWAAGIRHDTKLKRLFGLARVSSQAAMQAYLQDGIEGGLSRTCALCVWDGKRHTEIRSGRCTTTVGKIHLFSAKSLCLRSRRKASPASTRKTSQDNVQHAPRTHCYEIRRQMFSRCAKYSTIKSFW